MLTNHEHNNPNKAFTIDMPEGEGRIFLVGIDLSTPNSNIHGIVENSYQNSSFLIYDRKSDDHLLDSKISRYNIPRHNSQIPIHILVSNEIKGIAQEIISSSIGFIHRYNVKGFVAIDMNSLEKIANELNFLGCSVRVVDDLVDNPYIEDDEIYYDIFRSGAIFLDNEGVAEPSTQAEAVYAEPVVEELMDMQEILEMNDMPVAEAMITPMIGTATDYTNYMEGNTMVLFTKPTTEEDTEGNNYNLSNR